MHKLHADSIVKITEFFYYFGLDIDIEHLKRKKRKKILIMNNNRMLNKNFRIIQPLLLTSWTRGRQVGGGIGQTVITSFTGLTCILIGQIIVTAC